MIHGRYRTNYQGEFVLLDTVFRGGKKIQQREYIANPIHNQHISGMAAVIGSGISAKIGVVKLLPRHRGGLLGKKKLQTYAAQGVWRTMRVDFCVENSQTELQDMLEQKYTAHTVVYTRVKNCMAMPGSFYIVPYGVRLVPMAQAVYLAAFDGHQEIFLLGVDGTDHQQALDAQCIHDLNQVFSAYATTQFRLITDGASPPAAWLHHRNVSVWDYRKFISHCDI